MLTKTLRDGTVISYEYDALGRVTREKAVMPLDTDETPSIRETVYYRTGQKKEQRLLEKNTAGLFSAMVFSRVTFEPLVSRYLYNAKGQLAEQRDPEGVRKVFTFDANGSRAGFELYRDNSVEPEIELCYTYDNSGRLTQLKRGETTLASYSYDANGRKLTQTNANGTVSEYAYNAAGLVTRLENKLIDGENEIILSAWDYGYRLDGVQTSKTDNDGVKTSYTYDMVGRLTQEQTSTESEGADGETEVTVTGTIAYAYDGCGNRTSATATGFPVYSESYSYDGANRLVSRTRTEDGESVTTVNTYDANGNLIRSQKGEGASAEVTTRGYNGFGQQVSHTTAEREVLTRARGLMLRMVVRYKVQGQGRKLCSLATPFFIWS